MSKTTETVTMEFSKREIQMLAKAVFQVVERQISRTGEVGQNIDALMLRLEGALARFAENKSQPRFNFAEDK